ncbi:hypothetical protein I3842_06G129100 [Carya illinoinensis]|uniref:Uncharacterized protein n=1 Tax=Carya illinoinensis TaxID=32201 RepID=A0A922EV85_CARIL|nr:hypothetical protein I3842_06G129100 [Carya illinoinensis]
MSQLKSQIQFRAQPFNSFKFINETRHAIHIWASWRAFKKILKNGPKKEKKE